MLRAVALLFFTATLSGTACGKEESPRQACHEDAQKLCNDVKPGGGRILECLWNHYKDVSDDCYEAMQNIHPRADNGGAPPSHGNSNE